MRRSKWIPSGLLIGLVAFAASACSPVYVPPISTARGPASAPSVAIDSSWRSQPATTYQRDVGHMIAVYTNPAVGGTMFFESVPSDGLDAMSFLRRVCQENGDDAGCSTGLVDFDKAAGMAFDEPESGKSGVIFVTRRLGDTRRLLVCTGSWALYGQPDEREEQRASHVDRVAQICLLHSMR